MTMNQELILSTYIVLISFVALSGIQLIAVYFKPYFMSEISDQLMIVKVILSLLIGMLVYFYTTLG